GFYPRNSGASSLCVQCAIRIPDSSVWLIIRKFSFSAQGVETDRQCRGKANVIGEVGATLMKIN
ncbi:MAG: hypothetical protein KDI82_07255, partial [Gammaproteobacteria bacterium]|nr:hypothetical protein [Gammaproteobacteria bacterium]